MIKVVLFVLFPFFAFAQHVDYEGLSDEKLQVVLQKELQNMEAQGATPDLIMDKFVVDLDAYIQSREAYYRFVVHMAYIADKLLELKMQNGTDTSADFELTKKFKSKRTYQDYVNHKKTDAAKEAYENSTHDGILKLVVDDHEQYTEDEQKRYDGVIILLNKDPYFTHLNITDGQTSKIIMPNNK
jgi:bla regulator protein BlaR1